MKLNYEQANRAAWNQLVEPHALSDFYNVPHFLAGNSTLNHPELALLGDVRDKNVLHLQCHFGLDTLSLARMGARVTGLDFSAEGIRKARELAIEAQLDASFIEQSIERFRPDAGAFDVVFTSYGTITWLPDLKAWAKVIRTSLKKGGHFIFVDFHPAFWMFDSKQDKVQYSYFNRTVITEEQQGSYAVPNGDFTFKSHTWNHSLADITTALLSEGLSIQCIEELDYAPYPIFSNAEETSPGKFQIGHLKGMLPLVLGIKCIKL
jgi:2-polyprenyl-3-methyl-5-hydroxy-6-metoxy-1,4-benzoquinol methylase